jgi:hypothetical protein
MNRVMQKVKLAATARCIVGVTNNQVPAYRPNRISQVGLLTSGDRGRPEVSAIPSNPCKQPLTDVGRLREFTTELGCPDHVRVTPGRNRRRRHPRSAASCQVATTARTFLVSGFVPNWE